MKNSKSLIKAKAFAWMFFGSTIILLTVSSINQKVDVNKSREDAHASHFIVEKKIEKIVKKTKVERRRTQKNKIAPVLSSSILNSDIAGIDLGLGAFMPESMTGVDERVLGDMNNVVLDGELVDVAPRLKHQVPVVYPSRAKARDIEGYVVLGLLINKEGKVKNVRIIEAEPSGIFEKPAVRTVKSWLFEPAKYKGEAVESWANQTIRFELG